uniref:Galectin n=1 Tax=Salarias fasciatus TaxID=181472 RepID=A0A672FV30_SALFA
MASGHSDLKRKSSSQYLLQCRNATILFVGVSQFEINFGSDEFTIALHFNPRFNADGDHNTVVCNSFQDFKWGEEVKVGSFPFRQGQEFTVIIDFTPTKFVITLSDGSTINFPNRIGAKEYSVINVRGKVSLISLQIK